MSQLLRLVIGLLALALAGPGHAAPSTAARHALGLARCKPRGALCGRLARPLDPSGQLPGNVSVYFEYYPATGPGEAVGTLVATEGGPGYPATGSRKAYLALFGPLRADHDVLLMDNRGTGHSGAIDCPPLQRAERLLIQDIGACGAWLGPRAALYGTGYATDDLEAILAALRAGPVDLYGDSYGTFFAQLFALRHPARLRSLVLDGAYPLDAPELAWYPAYAPAMRAKFDAACARSPVCAAVPGSSMQHIAAALGRLRAAPHAARGVDVEGVPRRFRADAAALAIVMYGSAPAYATLRDTDAAARAYAAGDELPVLRLMAEADAAVDSRDASRSPRQFSAGLAAAVTCGDTPQIFDMALPPAVRRASLGPLLAARARTHPDGYAPFTIDEYRAMPPDYAFIDECLDWPAVPAAHPQAYRLAARVTFPSLPVLVLSGEFDDITGAQDAAVAAARYPHATHVVFANSLHVNALPDARSACGAKLVVRFLRELAAGDSGCAGTVPALHLSPSFARRVADVPPAVALAGNTADQPALRAAAAALYTAGDLLPRIAANAGGRGQGLRGGTFTLEAHGEARIAHLSQLRWTEDLWVSGTLRTAAHGAAGTATLRLRMADGRVGTLEARWPDGGPEAEAELTGELAGRALHARLPAP